MSRKQKSVSRKPESVSLKQKSVSRKQVSVSWKQKSVSRKRESVPKKDDMRCKDATPVLWEDASFFVGVCLGSRSRAQEMALISNTFVQM